MGTMFRQTSLAMGISASELREHRDRYDRACKRLLSEKAVLGWILHECLDEFREVEPAEIASRYIEGMPEVSATPVHEDEAAASRIVGRNAEDSAISEGTVWYDIRFSVLVPGTDESIGMIVNVEAQGDFYPGYPLLKRAAYYCGRLISSQRGTVFSGSHYERLQKVCSIWICPNPPAAFRNTMTRYAMAETQMVGRARLDRSEYDLVDIVLVCPDGDQQQKGDGILRLLGTLIASEKSAEERKAIITEEFGIPMSERLSDEVREMSNVSIGLEERWYRQGVDKGFERGEQAGYEKGKQAGYKRGEQAGYERGEQAGYERGEQAGYERGKQAGYERGQEAGYERGEQAGYERVLDRLPQLVAYLRAEGRTSEEIADIISDANAVAALLAEMDGGADAE